MKKILWFVFIFVVLLSAGYVVKEIDFVEVYDLLKNINLFWFCLAFFSCFASFLFWGFRFSYSLNGLFKGDFWFLMSTLFAGSFLNTVTPGASVGGEPFRAYLIGKKYKKSKIKVLGGILADKSFSILVFFFFLLFSILFVLAFVKIPFELKLFFEIILVSLFLALVVVGFFIWRKYSFSLSWFLRKLYWFGFVKKRFRSENIFVGYVGKKLKSFSKVFKGVVVNRKVFLVGVLLSFGLWFSNYFVHYFLFLSFGAQVSFLSVIIVVTLGQVIGDLSPFPGGIGLVEGSMFLLYSAMGVEFALAAVVALLGRMIFYFYSLLIGGICFLYLEFKLR